MKPKGTPRDAPMFYSLPGLGIASSRSGWDKDAVQLIFQAGITTESHQDRNQGTFLIYRNGWLAGCAKLGTRSGIAQEVDLHNCTQFGKNPQAWTQSGARIISQEDTPAYTFLLADLTAAYPQQ